MRSLHLVVNGLDDLCALVPKLTDIGKRHAHYKVKVGKIAKPRKPFVQVAVDL